MTRRIWDLTHVLEDGMPVYPGDEPATFRHTHAVARDGFQQSLYRLTNHSGTHVDGPRHFLPDGRDLAAYEPVRFLVRALTVRVDSRREISAADLTAPLHTLRPGDGVILVTGSYLKWGSPEYFGPFPVLSETAAAWLVKRGVSLLAVDTASVDPVGTTRYPIHHRLLAADCLIVENLAYVPDLPSPIRMAALPLKVRDSNGAPARVLAWED
ncbi:MAG: cyclase family protein [Clostridia bacterium]